MATKTARTSTQAVTGQDIIAAAERAVVQAAEAWAKALPKSARLGASAVDLLEAVEKLREARKCTS